MIAILALALVPAFRQAAAYYEVPVDELELGPGAVLPQVPYGAPWNAWDAWGWGGLEFPWVALDGPGSAVFVSPENGSALDGTPSERGALFVRTDAPRDVAGTLFLPKASGDGFLRLPFRIPAARASSNETAFRRGELAHYRRLLRSRVPGGAWFRHRADELSAALDPTLSGGTDVPQTQWGEPRRDEEALELFSGGRALYENLQLERGLPTSEATEGKIALDSLQGLTLRAIDWKPLLAPGETRLDPLAALVPADQHGLFFPSFQGLTDVLDEADRLGEFGLAVFEGRSSDALTRERYERQLCLELSALARTFGPLLVESAALTGSDPYLRSGSDVALLLRAKNVEAVRAYLALRQDGARTGEGGSEVRAVEGTLAGVAYRGVADSARSVSSYLAVVGDVVVVSNSLVQLERILQTAAKQGPALAGEDEFRFFRQRYALGSAGESGFLVLSDAAIRRWCSPRWRIGNARVVRAAGELADLHAGHLAELVAGPAASRDLGPMADFPDLGALMLTPAGVLSPRYGTLDFLTPIAELPLTHVTEREADLYRTWREGYERAWSNFFDPIGARLDVSAGKTSLDLTIRPLILDTSYADLRAMRGAGLAAGSGDPHPEALVHLALSVDPEWEKLKTVGMSLGPTAQALGADPFAWLGDWVAIYVDDGPVWDDLLQAEDMQEAIDELQENSSAIPLVVAIAVRDPLKLALFLTSLRAFVDGTAPGMTEWKDRAVGERRFVQIGSPGLGGEFTLFYATTPRVLFLSLNEAALLAAMEPERDPVELQRLVFREALECPGGGQYLWNAEWRTMESSVFGHPGAPREGLRRPRAWVDLARVGFALTFEQDGLRVRAVLERK